MSATSQRPQPMQITDRKIQFPEMSSWMCVPVMMAACVATVAQTRESSRRATSQHTVRPFHLDMSFPCVLNLSVRYSLNFARRQCCAPPR